jgi:hypothetical protein
MKIISHRGNLEGINPNSENNPTQIEKVINMDLDVEIDLRIKHGKLFLGHDYPQYVVNYEWLETNNKSLWIHAKDYDSVDFLRTTNFNWFWHDKDEMTITSQGFIWSNIGKYFNNGITVCLDYQELPNYLLGVCTDEPLKYLKNG